MRALIPTTLAVASLLAGCLVTVPGSQGTVVVPGAQPITQAGVTNPVITSFTANPMTLKVGQPLTVQIEAVSPSGRTLQYVWSATDGTLSATSGKLIVWTAPTTAGTYSVLVSVTDGVGGQAAASLNITVTASGEVAVSPPALSTPAPVSTGQGSTASQKATWSQVFGVKGIKDFHFLNSSVGWVIQRGDTDDSGGKAAGGATTAAPSGTPTRIRHTTDGGRTWQSQFELVKPDYEQTPLSTIYFADTQNGWAGGYNGTLLRTTDEGKTWALVDWSGAGQDWISSIRFKDLAEGLMTGGRALLRSTDGGATWNQVAELPNGGSLAGYFPNGKAFLNAYDGAVEQVYLYENGTLSKVSGIDRNRLTSVSFPDPSNTLKAWAVTEGGLYKSEDGGASFTKVEKLNLGTEFITTYSVWCLAFSSPTDGMILTSSNPVDQVGYVTRDGGKTWARTSGSIGSNAYVRPQRLQLFDLNNGFCGLEFNGGLTELFRLSP